MSTVINLPERGGLAAANPEGCRQLGLLPTLPRTLARSTVNVRWMGGRQWQLEDLDAIARAMRIPVARLLLPRLDSNQEPTGSLFPLVSATVIDLFTRERAT